MEAIEKNIKPYEPSYNTMVPTPIVQFFRTCILWQIVRFIVINLKMIRVVQKSHH